MIVSIGSVNKISKKDFSSHGLNNKQDTQEINSLIVLVQYEIKERDIKIMA